MSKHVTFFDVKVSAVLTLLPPRESFASGHAGAIAILVSRLALPEDIVTGMPIRGMALDGGQFRPLRLSAWGFFRNLRYRRACLKMVRSIRPELVEVHNRPDLAAYLSRFCRVRLILHNDPCSMRGAKTAVERQWLARRVLVCGVSEWVKDRYCEGCAAVRFEVQPNCIDLETLQVPLCTREKLVLFAGRVVADKGVDAFVRAWGAIRHLYPEWRAIIIGADRFGPDTPDTPFLRNLRPVAEKAGVEMLGYQCHAQVMQAMSRAAIVVVPSRWAEPFGMTALEAMANGAAVIAAPVGALESVVGQSGLMAHPDREGELEGALCRLLDDSALRDSLGERGRKAAIRFDLSASRLRLEELRREAIAFSRARGAP